jgi:hypothetical protein
MSDRLAQLRRQRALVQEHLVWLDREIATAAGSDAPAPADPFSRAPLVPTAPGASPAEASRPTRDPFAAAESILEDYRVPPEKVQSNVKLGCLLYLLAAFALVALAVAGLYFALEKK